MKTYILKYFILINCFMAFTAQSQTPKKSEENTIKCKIPFKVNKWDVEVSEIADCFEGIPKSKVISFDIYATASPDGYHNDNNELSIKRVQAITRELKKLFPRVTRFNSIAGGKSSSLMRSALIIANLRKEPKPQPPIDAYIPEEQPTCPEPISCSECPREQEPRECPVISDEPINGGKIWVWLGPELVYTTGLVAEYIQNPSIGFVLGVGIPFTHSNYANLYSALIYDAARGSANLGLDFYGVNTTSYYQINNYHMYLGFEVFPLPKYISFYIEGGLVIQQRTFLLREDTGSVDDYYITTTVGAGVNLGLNFIFPVTDETSFFIKGNLNAMIGIPKEKNLFFTNLTTTVNVNSLNYSPSISLGFRF